MPALRRATLSVLPRESGGGVPKGRRGLATPFARFFASARDNPSPLTYTRDAMPTLLPARRATFLPALILLTGCGESWNWDASAAGKDTAAPADIHDLDRDGFDDLAAGGDDCDDADATVNPSAIEVWYDGIDQNCAADDDFD